MYVCMYIPLGSSDFQWHVPEYQIQLVLIVKQLRWNNNDIWYDEDG